MEFEDVGTYCHYDLCGQHTYLPLECSGCNHQFCTSHIDHNAHQCPHHSLYTLQQNDSDTHSHGLTYNTCAYSKCNQQTPITILCKQCNQLFCVQHRYVDDHNCQRDLGDDTYANIEELKLEILNEETPFDIARQPSDDIQYQSITRMQNVATDVIDTHKFNELRDFGYSDKQIYNAWYCIKSEYPKMTPNDGTFMNKMIDTLSMEQNTESKCNQFQYYSNHIKSESKQTMSARTPFDCRRTCESLHEQISLFSSKKSKDKVSVFTNFICETTNYERQKVKFHYKQGYLVNLDHYIKVQFKGSIFKRMVLYSMQTELERNEYMLRIAIKKMKDINCITQVLCTLDSDKILELVTFHNKGLFRKALKTQILKLTANDFKLQIFLLNIINGMRDKSYAFQTLDSNNKRDILAKDLSFVSHVLLKLNWTETEEREFINIFSQRSFEYLHLLCQAFAASANMSLMEACDNALGSEKGIGYALHLMLGYLMDTNAYYIDLLHRSMRNGCGGHKYILFWKIIFDRIDIDLEQILSSVNESDVDRYSLKLFINTTLHKQDANSANLIAKLCKLS